MKASQLSVIGGFSILIILPPLPSTSSFPPRRHSTCLPRCFPCAASTTTRTRQSTPHFHVPSSNLAFASPRNLTPSTPSLYRYPPCSSDPSRRNLAWSQSVPSRPRTVLTRFVLRTTRHRGGEPRNNKTLTVELNREKWSMSRTETLLIRD